MAESMSDEQKRGLALTAYWGAECKDCAAERRMHSNARSDRGKSAGSAGGGFGFEYSGSWADRAYEIGQTRSDRCEFHRRAHREAIRALSVPYVNLDVIGKVRDRQNPTGPLGGLGPLPKPHVRKSAESNLQELKFGMGDADILTILGGLREKRVAVIEAGTGTGKSTFMPFRLMNPPQGAAFRPIEAGQIIVTEPRRQAAIGVATFVGEALVFGHDSRNCKSHIGPGFPVGYQVSGDRKWDMACDLIYVTDGTMINWVRDGSLARIGMVIVDEAHERSANIDIILAQLREKIQEYKHLRVIITSATIDRDFFIDYFGGETQVFHHSIPAQKSFGYGVPFFVDLSVDISVITNGLTLNTAAGPISFQGWSGFGSEHEGFPPDDLKLETKKYAALCLGREIPKESWVRQMPRALADQVVAIAEGTEFGDILGFLPTSATIDAAINQIKRGLKERGLQFDVYPLLSSTEPSVIRAAVAARHRGEKRKIVISSNLAETSLTVSGVRYVVDSGLICQSEWNADIASGSLPKVPHSQSGLRQRWGRVGRDAPGWVFPLYTAEQFLSLARDTPPESTRKNLEEFCTRLISTGLNPETAVLPGNFRSSRYQPDQFAEAAAENFTKELSRASRMLRSGGIVDTEGDLTDLGREIERYPGAASEALAIALGDRLACLHEVALGIVLVTRAKLYGGKHRILGTDFDWPPEWRLRADACHRALSLGCKDDLELALRIVSLYEGADDRERWCRTWWVNRGALDAALAEISLIVGNLSAAMKHQVTRPFQLSLLSRARAALAQAFQDQVYRKAYDGTFTSVSDGKAATGPSRTLVPAPNVALAFSRIEVPNGLGQMDRRIHHFVKVEEGESSGAEPKGETAPDDFDALLRLASRRKESSESDSIGHDLLRYARATAPIGCVVHFDLSSDPDGAARITAIRRIREPFLQWKSAPSLDNQDDDSGYDPDWSDQGNDDAIPDEYEIASQPTNPRGYEVNDQADGSYERVPGVVHSPPILEQGDLQARPLFGSEKPEEHKAYLVSDYAVNGSQVAILLEPFNEAQRDMDPARHDTRTCFEEVEVKFLDQIEDAAWSFLRFRTTDNQERFDVSANEFFSLDRHADSPPCDLVRDLTLKAVVVVPTPNRRSISVRPFLRGQLEKAGIPWQARNDEVRRLYPAHISSELDSYGNINVEVEDIVGVKGIALQVEIRAAWAEANGIALLAGQRLQVGVKLSPGQHAVLNPITDEVQKIVKGSRGRLKAQGNRVVALAPLDLALARRLSTLDTNEKWSAAVSNFFEESYFVDGVLVLPPFESGGYISARLPKDAIGRFIGTEGQNLRELQALPKINRIWIEDDILHVVGETQETVKTLLDIVKARVETAVGVVTVPKSQIGEFIGGGGKNIKRAALLSKTRTFRTGIDGSWRIEGASVSALQVFASLARLNANDLALNVISFTGIEILPSIDRQTASPVPATKQSSNSAPTKKQSSNSAHTTKQTSTTEHSQKASSSHSASMKKDIPAASPKIANAKARDPGTKSGSEQKSGFWRRLIARLS